MNKTSSKLSARDVSSRTGYSTSYISDLCRSKKINGEQINGKWIIDEASLDNFIHENIARKKEYATHLANIRGKEYCQARKKIYGLVGHLNHRVVGITSKHRLAKMSTNNSPAKNVCLHTSDTDSNTNIFHSALASGFALALAFVCMFSAYGTASQIFSKQPVTLRNNQASVFLESAHLEHKVIAISKDFSSAQILKSVAHNYSHVGEVNYKLMRQSLNAYRDFILTSGESALAVSATTRDKIVATTLSMGYTVQDMAYVPIRVYTNAVYTLVKTAPHIIDISGHVVLAIGNSIMKGTNTGVVATATMYKNVNASTQKTLSKHNVDNISRSHENSGQIFNVRVVQFSHSRE